MAQRGGDDLADMLANMAGDETPARPTSRPEAPAARPAPAARVHEEPDEEEIDAEVEGEIDAEIEDEGDDDGFETLHEAAPTSAPRPRTPVRRAKKQNQSVKEFGAPVLLTVGLLLMIPAIWAIMILRGSQSAWGAERDDAAGMAKLMLACGPIALILIGSGVYLFLDIMRSKNKRG